MPRGLRWQRVSGKKHEKNKYGSKKTERDGILFDSQKEARYYDGLKIRRDAGEVSMFLMQVPFHLPGKTVYRVDFQVFEADGSVRFIDVKGRETQTFRLKKRQVEELYPLVEIELA